MAQEAGGHHESSSYGGEKSIYNFNLFPSCVSACRCATYHVGAAGSLLFARPGAPLRASAPKRALSTQW